MKTERMAMRGRAAREWREEQKRMQKWVEEGEKAKWWEREDRA